jgi:hypothetical protein
MPGGVGGLLSDGVSYPDWALRIYHFHVVYIFHLLLYFFNKLAILKQVRTTSALKITLKNWNRYGMMCINPAMAIGGHMS